MRRIARIALFVLAGVVLMALAGMGWLYFYSYDLPDIGHLRGFAPTNPVVLTDDCLDRPVMAIPYQQIGKNLQDAITSVEFRQKRATLSEQIARTLFCQPDKQLSRHLKELRTSLQLDLHFSHEELLTIYPNRVPMGDCVHGVETTANCRFHKHASELTLSEAALIAGLPMALLLYRVGPIVARAAAVISIIVIVTAPLSFARLERLPALTEGADDVKLSAGHRLLIWSFAGDQIAEQPLAGWGLDSSRAIPGGEDLIRAGE